jgi:hypothetical protein
MTRVNVGDTPSPAICLEAIYATGRKVENSHAEVGSILQKSVYVDDICHSTENDVKKLAEDTEKILNDHGFQIKKWLFSGDDHDSQDMPHVLGLAWEPHQDILKFPVELNFSPKKKGIRSGPNVQKQDLAKAVPEALTKRVCLEQTSKFFDPLGLLGPFILMAKMLLRTT